jgi:hypothetical protein
MSRTVGRAAGATGRTVEKTAAAAARRGTLSQSAELHPAGADWASPASAPPSQGWRGLIGVEKIFSRSCLRWAKRRRQSRLSDREKPRSKGSAEERGYCVAPREWRGTIEPAACDGGVKLRLIIAPRMRASTDALTGLRPRRTPLSLALASPALARSLWGGKSPTRFRTPGQDSYVEPENPRAPLTSSHTSMPSGNVFAATRRG